MKNDNFKRLEHKQVSPTTFKRYDEFGLFEMAKENLTKDNGNINHYKIMTVFFMSLISILLSLFLIIFVIRLALSIPL